MGKFLLPMLALGMLLGGAKAARAGFFDACLAPGSQTITVVQDTTVRSERATFQTNGSSDTCFIVVNEEVRLSLIGVQVSVVGNKYILFEGGDTSTLSIESSTIKACDNDIFGFAQVRIASSNLLDPAPNISCDVKELFVTGDITITSSTLTSDIGGGDSDIKNQVRKRQHYIEI